MAGTFFCYNLAKEQDFKNRYIKFMECLIGKVHSKFQIPSITVIQINVHCVSFQYGGFLHLLHLNEMFKN